MASSSFLLAYLLSPWRARHPYLLWTALTGALGGVGVEYVVVVAAAAAGRRRGEEGSGREWDEGLGVGLFDEGGFDERDGVVEGEELVNGEDVRARVERFRVLEGLRASVVGVAFAMGVVGIWGDGC